MASLDLIPGTAEKIGKGETFGGNMEPIKTQSCLLKDYTEGEDKCPIHGQV